ncbi:MAG: hypothetical protein V3T05_06040, partial [Myxococcota bacterium]
MPHRKRKKKPSSRARRSAAKSPKRKPKGARKTKTANEAMSRRAASRRSRRVIVSSKLRQPTTFSGNESPPEASPPAPTQDVEPTTTQMAAEQNLIDERRKPHHKTRNIPPAGKDLLASYMEQLSHIPLFTPQQEVESAQRLEVLELRTWHLILATPKGVHHLHGESTEIDDSIRRKIELLLQSYRRAAARTRRRQLPEWPARTKLIKRIAPKLRLADFDKVLLDRVLQRMRREVWGRRVIATRPAFRLTHT